LIRGQRLVKAMTQTALAKELGVAFQQVHKKEGGANQVSSSRLVQIAEALEVDPSFFFPGNGKADRAESEVLGLLNTMGATRLLRAFAEIGDGNVRHSIVVLTVSLRNPKVQPCSATLDLPAHYPFAPTTSTSQA
jgi:transcriptional regulator with XRE-family HTH domain